MAITNRDRVGRAMDLLKDGLRPFVERELTAKFGKYWITEVTQSWKHDIGFEDDDTPKLDAAPLLRLIWDQWHPVFSKILGFSERSIVSELRDYRNKWAHQEAISSDDTYRVLDSASRLLTAISAPQAAELETMKIELLRVRFEEQARSQKRKALSSAIEISHALKPWREVITPHQDVASGRYQQAEFAADLWQVYLGEGTDEYRDPIEFFRRTFLTDSLTSMLIGAIRRLAGKGGDPVVQLQTNFGGGKTHSMLSLYHLFSGEEPTKLHGLEEVLRDAEAEVPKQVRRVVLVGNKISPGNPTVKANGTIVRTLWGELAWQLGGKEAFDRIAADDERATNPGDALRQLFVDYGPSLILVDEWVAYARQLHDEGDMPGGSFDTQFSFAQALTEGAKLAQNCLLVVSIPASDSAATASGDFDDVEVGGQRGRDAVDRLRRVVGRLDSSWRPATAEEGFEIVRRRLFQPMSQDQYKDRDVVIKAFANLYSTQNQQFPPECRERDYEKRMAAAYPIHPEIFDRLYNDWSTLVKFQRTRGVLRLMAAVIHSLWDSGDKNPVILPCNIPIDDPRVQPELTRNLPDHWVPVIEKDVDGANSLPHRLDSEIPNLGKYHAARRVARTVYMGSAPLSKAANRGIEDRRINLGCLMPGENTGVFGDALRRLANSATYLYADGARYWYSTQPTVTKMADDRAEQLRSNPDKVEAEIERRLKKDLEQRGDFAKVHPLPHSGLDVSDELDARLVVLRTEDGYSKDADCPALKKAKSILESRGNSPRLYRNTLVFLAPDQTRWQDLEEATRRYLAWESILNEKDGLNLDPNQVRQAESQRKSADGGVVARIPEVYQWVLVPTQDTPQAALTWEPIKLPAGTDPLAVKSSQRLRHEERLLVGLGGVPLRMTLDKVPLWRGNHVSLKQLVEDFASYPYLQRLRDPQKAASEAVRRGVGELLWMQETFAYAEGYDEATNRYRGLVGGDLSSHDLSDLTGLVVKPDVAIAQMDADKAKAAQVTVAEGGSAGGGIVITDPVASGGNGGPAIPATPRPPKRFHGSVELDAERVSRDAGKIAEEVVAHLNGLLGAKVRVTMEIEAYLPEGTPAHVVRAVTENARTLKFTTQGFEAD